MKSPRILGILCLFEWREADVLSSLVIKLNKYLAWLIMNEQYIIMYSALLNC
jgi:hypothetical protein